MKVIMRLATIAIVAFVICYVSHSQTSGNKTVALAAEKAKGPIVHPYSGEKVCKTPGGKSFTPEEYKKICSQGIKSILKNQLIWMSTNKGKYVVYFPIISGDCIAIYHTVDVHSVKSDCFSAMRTETDEGKIRFSCCPTRFSVGSIKDDRMSIIFNGGPSVEFYTNDLK